MFSRRGAEFLAIHLREYVYGGQADEHRLTQIFLTGWTGFIGLLGSEL